MLDHFAFDYVVAIEYMEVIVEWNSILLAFAAKLMSYYDLNYLFSYEAFKMMR